MTGFTYVSVFGASDCYYSIFYQISYLDKDISSAIYLNDGYILQDFYNRKDYDYNLYIFSSRRYFSSLNIGIIFSLTSEIFDYDLYVYNDKDEIYYNKTTNKMENFLWFSDQGQIMVETTDRNYKSGSLYYIAVVLKSEYYNNEITNSLGKYYISGSFEGSPLVIYEGITNMLTLNNMKNQSYIFYTYNKSNNVFISLSTFNGEVNLYANLFKPISNTADAKYRSNGGALQSIIINSLDIPNILLPYYTIHILVEKKTNGSEYSLSVDTNPDKPILFKKSISSVYQVLPTETKYHYTTINRNDTGIINVDFVNGGALLYGILISNSSEIKKFQHQWPKPDKLSNNLPIESESLGYSIRLSKDFITNCDPCILLLSVTGNKYRYKDLDISYSISYVTSALKISFNTPIIDKIGANQYNYYKFTFPKSVFTMYVQLYNVAGDSNLIINYGEELPTLDSYHWRGSSSYMDLIDIDINDNFFTNRQINSIQGIYTVGVVGYTNSMYTLYVTSHSKKIQNLKKDISSACMTKSDEDYCYFRYETGSNIYNKSLTYEIESLMVKTNYVYGSGIIVATIFNSTGENDIFQQLPSINNYRWSSQNQTRTDYLLMNVDKFSLVDQNGYLDILVAIYCKKRCFSKITPTMKSESIDFDNFLIKGVEKYIYMEAYELYHFKFNTEKSKNTLLKTDLFFGHAEMTVQEIKYTNNLMLSTTVKWVDLNENNQTQLSNFTRTNNYEQNDQCIISFIIKTLNQTGLSLKIIDMTQLEKFNVGNENQLMFISDTYSGYFEVLSEYESIIINLFTLIQQNSIKIYAKLKIVDKNKFYNNSKADIADENDYDYMDEYDKGLNKFSLNLPGVKYKDDNSTKNNRSQIPIYILTIKTKGVNTSPPIISLSIIPKINSITRFDLTLGKPIYTEIEVSPTTFHLYDIGKLKSKDRVYELQISQCSGKIKFHLSNQINYIGSDVDKTIENFDYKYGTYKILLQDIQPSYFLTVFAESGKKKIETCFYNFFKSLSCQKLFNPVANYMVYIKSFNKDNYITYEPDNVGIINYDISEGNSIRIFWSGVLKKFISDNEAIPEKTNSLYKVFVSDNSEDLETMNSICLIDKKNSFIHISHILNETSYVINNLKSNKKYYVNVIAMINDTMNIAYDPLEIHIIFFFTSKIKCKFFVKFRFYHFYNGIIDWNYYISL